ncbi:hypothetical protein P5V15_013733 [Pogonomyrmex californicus]
MACTATSSKTATDEAPQENYIWMELRLLQSIVVQSRLGQALLKFADNFLWIVEKCTEWSLPRQENVGDENQKALGKPELVRPLPWLLFLPSLVMLRLIRLTLNIGAFVFGYSNITPSEMIKFVQLSRRYLNTVKNEGMKERYESKDKISSINEAKKALIRSIRLTLSSLSCLDASRPSLSPPPTKIHVNSSLDPDPVIVTPEEKSVTESMDSVAKSRNSTSESEEEKEEALNEKIDRLDLESSENDEDFDPANCISSDMSSNEDDDDDDDDDDNVSLSEVRDIKNDLIDKNHPLNQFLQAERAVSLIPKEKIDEPRSSAKESRDKVEERLATSQQIDSPECHTPDRSSQEGDPIFYSPISSDNDTPKKCSVSSASIAEQSKSSGGTNNGAVMQKRNTNVSKYHKGKRASHGNRKKK